MILFFHHYRTKAYGFGIFYAGQKEQQPCIFLAGKSETESQKWMKSIRDVLKPPTHLSKNHDQCLHIILLYYKNIKFTSLSIGRNVLSL